MELNGIEMMQSSFYTTEIHDDDWHAIQTYGFYLRPTKCQYIMVETKKEYSNEIGSTVFEQWYEVWWTEIGAYNGRCVLKSATHQIHRAKWWNIVWE